MVGIETVEDLGGVFAGDIAVADVLANYGAILGFHQSVVVAVPGPVLVLLISSLLSRRAPSA